MRAAARELHHIETVSVFHDGVDRVAEQVSFGVERNVAHAADELVASIAQINDEHIGAARPGREGAGSVLLATATSAASASGATATATARADARSAAAQHEVRGRWSEDRLLHVLPRLHTAGSEFAQFKSSREGGGATGATSVRRAGWGSSATTPATSAGRRDGIDLIGDPARIGGKGRVRRTRYGDVRIGLEIQDMELRLRVHRKRVCESQSVAHPFSVGGNL